MPAVFIHGVPETFRVWDLVIGHLSRKDVLPLALPGFDSPIPHGFTATKEEYVEWIIRQLEEMDEPVDLVGHDWGCLLTMRVVAVRPDLIRSWAAGSGPVSKQYEWHPLAKIWQNPGEGEKWMKDIEPSDLAKFMESIGLPVGQAEEAVSHLDAAMKDSILRLYRSALHVGAEWQPGLATIQVPGMVFWGEKDAACPIEFADQLARDANAHRVLKLDADHWTIVERSVEVADNLEAHWSSVNSL